MDIQKNFPAFQRIQLDRWEKKGYLKKLKRGFYTMADQNYNEDFLYLAANKMYKPSYISLEKSLEYYGFIPEAVFQITSVSTKKTTRFSTPVGHFLYRHLKPELFFGYRLIHFQNKNLLMAEPEKALLDYFYLHPKLQTADDFQEMRINTEEFFEKIDLKKLQKYLEAFSNKSLKRRVEKFLKTLQHDSF